MRHFWMIGAFWLVGTGLLHAQNEIDLLRLGLTRSSPTARMAAMGGAFTALGADAGGLTVNPAGIATFRRSTLNISPGLHFAGSTGTFRGAETSDFGTNAFIGSLGYIHASKPSNGKLKQLNYGFTLNRTGDFFGFRSYEGVSRDHSLVDFFVDEANSNPVAFNANDFPFTAGLARTAGLIFPSIPNNDSSLFLGIIPNGGITQSDRQISRGSVNEYAFSFGANYDNFLFVGGSLGLVSSLYSFEANYRERDNADTIFDFRDLLFRQEQTVSADGFLFKIGAIVQPVNWLRIGFNFEAPTRFNVVDDYQTRVEANFDSVPTFGSASSPLFLPFTYRFRKPGKIGAGIAFLYEDRATLSVDYDYLDLSSMRVTNEADDAGNLWASNLNSVVRSSFQPSHNVRVGAEYIWGPLAFRAGWAWWGSPYRDDVPTGGADMSRMDFTGGAGMRLGKMGIDLSVVHNRMNAFYQPYFLEGRPNYDVRFTNTNTFVQTSLTFRLD